MACNRTIHPQHNKAEDAIRELRKRAKAQKAKYNILPRLWDFLYKYESDLLSMIPVCRIFDQPQQRTDKAKAGRERVLSTYTYEHNAEDFERIYNSIMKN